MSLCKKNLQGVCLKFTCIIPVVQQDSHWLVMQILKHILEKLPSHVLQPTSGNSWKQCRGTRVWPLFSCTRLQTHCIELSCTTYVLQVAVFTRPCSPAACDCFFIYSFIYLFAYFFVCLFVCLFVYVCMQFGSGCWPCVLWWAWACFDWLLILFIILLVSPFLSPPLFQKIRKRSHDTVQHLRGLEISLRTNKIRQICMISKPLSQVYAIQLGSRLS